MIYEKYQLKAIEGLKEFIGSNYVESRDGSLDAWIAHILIGTMDAEATRELIAFHQRKPKPYIAPEYAEAYKLWIDARKDPADFAASITDEIEEAKHTPLVVT